MAKIHPTAMVDGGATLGENVEIGPYCVVESDVVIGDGTILRSGAIVRRYTTLGEGNLVDSFAVLGGVPQDTHFDPATVTYVRIGDGNTFREGVTISRATVAGGATVIGSNTYWMSTSHAGHDAVVEDDTILTNGALVGGHCVVGKRVFFSAHASVHQFCWIGDLVMLQGNGGASCHVPPYTMVANINNLVGLNSIGLKRADYITDEDRRQIKEAFHITYRSGLLTSKALEKMDQCSDWGPAAGKFRDFIRRVLAAEGRFNRPLIDMRARH